MSKKARKRMFRAELGVIMEKFKSISIIMYLCFFTTVFLAGCARERITVEQPETSAEEEAGEEAANEVHAVSTSTVEVHDYMENKFRELESEAECTRIECFFPFDEEAASKEKKWEEISSLPEVEKAVIVTEGLGTTHIPLDKVNPDYYEYLVKQGSEEALIQQYGYVEFNVHFYTSSEMKQNTLGCWHQVKNRVKESGGWFQPVWPFYIEKGESIELLYNDRNEVNHSKDLVIDKVSDEIPWYLDFAWPNTECILMLTNDKFEELMGKDEKGVNLSSLAGNERYYLTCKRGQRKKLEEKVKKLGIKEVSNPGYLKR